MHRNDIDEKGHTLPAVAFTRTEEAEWWIEGKRHRSDKDTAGLILPAVCKPPFAYEWWQNGMKHRDERDNNGFELPAVIHPFFDRIQIWKNGKFIRNDGIVVKHIKGS